MIGELEIAARLFLALLLGGLIGLERESLGRPAGLRTHILVSIGSALVFLVSVWGFEGLPYNADRARLAAQVVSGVGFLGAGTIMREGVSVRGLTTAASLWVVAGIGLAAGAGLYFTASLSTLLVFFSLQVLNKVEHRFFQTKHNLLTLRIVDEPGRLGEIGIALGAMDVDICSVRILPEDDIESTLEIEISAAPGLDRLALLESLRALDGVKRVGFKGD